MLIVLAGIHRTLFSAWRQLSQQHFDFAPLWLIAAGVLYLIGLLPTALYWRWLLQSLGLDVTLLAALRAHYVGHLGKYVPGKAMVFVIRVGLLPNESRKVSAASIAVYYETMMMMVVGACLATVILSVWYRLTGVAVVIAAVATCAGLLSTLPPSLRLGGKMIRRFHPESAFVRDLQRIRYRQVAMGWIANLLVWAMLGLSFWTLLRGMAAGATIPFSDIPFEIATIGLAVVAGFASMIPGGAIVREVVVLELLEPRYGSVVALMAAIMLRVVWLLSELAFSAILYPMGWRRRDLDCARTQETPD